MFSDEKIKPESYPNTLIPNIKYRNHPRSVQNSPRTYKRSLSPGNANKLKVLHMFEENTGKIFALLSEVILIFLFRAR